MVRQEIRLLVAVAWVSGLVRLFPLLRGSRMSGLRTRTRMRRCLSHGMRGRGGGAAACSAGAEPRVAPAERRRAQPEAPRVRPEARRHAQPGEAPHAWPGAPRMVRRARLLMRGRRSGGMVARTGFLMQGGKPSRVFAGLRRLMGHAGGAATWSFGRNASGATRSLGLFESRPLGAVAVCSLGCAAPA